MATPSNDEDFDKELDAADAEVNAEFSAKLKLSPAHIQSICPKQVDQDALNQLMKAVNGAANENDARRHLITNAETYAGVLVKLLKAIAIA